MPRSAVLGARARAERAVNQLWIRALRGAAVALFALLTAGLLLLGGPAQAHNYYVSSTPADGEVLTVLPEQFIVTTNDNLLELGGAGGFVLQVIDERGLFYGDGCVIVSGPSFSMAAAIGEPGDYTLAWQAVSADGHTISGEVPFSWQPKDDEASAVATAGASSAPVCPGSTVSSPGGSETPNEAGTPFGDMVWIGVAVVAVAVAGIATMLLLGRNKKD